MNVLTIVVNELTNNEQTVGTVTIGTNPVWSQYGPHGSRRRGGRSYWNRRLDDWNEATSGEWG